MLRFSWLVLCAFLRNFILGARLYPTNSICYPQIQRIAGIQLWLVYCSQKRGVSPMSQEVSVSYQAVKSKVYKLIDAAVEGEKTEAQVQESLERWWRQVHPADRAVAYKYLLRVLERSRAGVSAMARALPDTPESPSPLPEKLAKPWNAHSTAAGTY